MQAMSGTMWALGAANKAPVISWWLSGGISAANCIAAYAPKGAASLAESYVNLNAPGTNNATPVVAPNFDALTGWGFTGSQYLEIAVNVANGWTMLIRYSDAVASASSELASNYDGADGFGIGVAASVDYYWDGGGSTPTKTPRNLSGVRGVGNHVAWLNGAKVTGLTGSWGTWTASPVGGNFRIGRRGTSGANPFTGNIQAFALYSSITDAQITAVSNAMAAL